MRLDTPKRAVPGRKTIEYDNILISPFALNQRGFSPISRSGATVSPVALTLDDVRRIAHLARIDIDAAQAEDVHGKLTAIFGLIDQLNAIDTTGISPMAHAQDVVLPLREDRVTETDRHALFQREAPAVEDSLYLVPKVIE